MAWAIITIYTSKCPQMDPKQQPETSTFYSRCKKCDIKKNLRGWVPPPLGSPKVNDERSYAANLPYIRHSTKFVSCVSSEGCSQLRLVRLSSMNLSQVGWTTVTACLQDYLMNL